MVTQLPISSPPPGAKARLSARVTSPEVNEVFKRNSQLWQAELSPGSKEVIPVVTTTETKQEPNVSYSNFGECGESGCENIACLGGVWAQHAPPPCIINVLLSEMSIEGL